MKGYKWITPKSLLKEHENKLLLEEIPLLDHKKIDEYIRKNYPQVINEMSRVNTKEFYGLFPSNKFEINVWSNDHNPPHMHILTNDGWELKVNIETAEVETKKMGKSSSSYSYIIKNIADWLNSPNALKKDMTNRDVAQLLWATNNPDES